jgi:glycosyltransferase involved in cell wall biosynthesis
MTIQKYKFVIIFDSFLFGGAERQGLFLARYIKSELGARVNVLVLNGQESGLLKNHLERLQIEYDDLKFTFESTHIKRGVRILGLAKKIRQHAPDILIPFTIRPNVNVNAIWQLTGAKLCLWNQRDLDHGFSFNRKDKIFLWALRNTSGFVSNSNEGIASLNKFKETSNKTKQKISNGIEIDAISNSQLNLRNLLNLNENCIIVTMVANITQYKDHVSLVRVWNEILSEWNEIEKPVLVLVGDKAENYKNISEYVIDSGISSHVKFMGKREDVISILTQSDIGILCSLKEGMSNAIMEYMYVGLPVLASNIEGNRECLGGDYLYLYETSDSSDLNTKLLQLLSMTPQQRKELGSTNEKRIKQQFSTQKMGRSFMNFITNNVKS